jgi:hypothetical protein
MKLPANLWTFLRNAVPLALALAVVVLILPSKARSQLGLDPCCAIISAGLDAISGLLKSVVAKPLASIQQIEQQASDFEQQVVWPSVDFRGATAARPGLSDLHLQPGNAVAGDSGEITGDWQNNSVSKTQGIRECPMTGRTWASQLRGDRTAVSCSCC